jgi:hypothetical protein
MSHSPNCSHGNSRPHLGEFCPISATGLLGLVAVLYSNKNPYLFGSGLVVLGLVACRSVLLLLSIMQAGYRRESGFIPWRCFVLIFPVMLFLFGPPITSAKSIRGPQTKSNAIYMTWEEVKAWTNDEAKREWSQGRIGVIVGNYFGSKSGRAFGLSEPRVFDNVRTVSVVCDQDIGDIKTGLVQVTGEIQYRKGKTTDEYHLVLKVRSREDIVPVERLDDP